MPNDLAHIRRTAELATSAASFTPHAGVELQRHAGEWILALVGIVEAIASTENITVRDENYGARVCRYCKGDPVWVEKWDREADEDASYWDAEHGADCPHLLAQRLKEGRGGDGARTDR